MRATGRCTRVDEAVRSGLGTRGTLGVALVRWPKTLVVVPVARLHATVG